MRHSRLTTHIGKDAKLERLLRDILAECRANRTMSSPGVRVRRTAHGTTLDILPSRGGGPPEVKQFVVNSEQYNYLTCQEWNDATQAGVGPIVYVAKPHYLRMYFQTPLIGNTISVTTTSWGYKVITSMIPSGPYYYKNARLVTFDGAGVGSLQKDYYEYVDPPYVANANPIVVGAYGVTVLTVPDPKPDGWSEEQRFLITAIKPSNGVGLVKADIGVVTDDPKVEWLDITPGRCWRKEIEVCDKGVTRYMRIDTSQIYAGAIIPRNA